MTDKFRIDLSKETPRGAPHVHLRGYHGDGGENEGVLSISAAVDAGPNFPECGRIFVGSPQKSPLLEGYIPNLGSFCCSPDAADRLADELRAMAKLAREAMEKGVTVDE